MKRIPVSGGLLVFLGAAFWSLNSPLVKYLSLDSVLICGLRSLIAAIVLAVTIRPKQLKWNWWMVIYMCSYAGLCLSIILALGATSCPCCYWDAIYCSYLAFPRQFAEDQKVSYTCLCASGNHLHRCCMLYVFRRRCCQPGR